MTRLIKMDERHARKLQTIYGEPHATLPSSEYHRLRALEQRTRDLEAENLRLRGRAAQAAAPAIRQAYREQDAPKPILSAWQTIEAEAGRLQAREPALTKAQAVTRVMHEQPHLYTKHREEEDRRKARMAAEEAAHQARRMREFVERRDRHG